jgi:hypothetical protein
MVKIRHWQLFIILFLLPVVVMFSLPDEVVLDNSPQGLVASVIIMAIYLSILLFWVLTLGYKLYKRKPLTVDLKTEYFLFLASLIIIVAYIGFLFWTILNFTHKKEVPSFVFPTLTAMSFFGIGCIFYCWKFIAKTLKIVELNRVVSRNEWFWDAVTFFFYPAGVWKLQPRVNKIFYKSSNL